MPINETPDNIFDDILVEPPVIRRRQEALEPVRILFAHGPEPWQIVTPLAWIDDYYFIYGVKRGGMGVIWLCGLKSKNDSGDDIFMAIGFKTFHRQYMLDPIAREAFRNECATWLKLSHLPGVFPASGLHEFGQQPFIGMPAVHPGVLGETNLRDLINMGPLPFSKVILFSLRMATAMALARRVDDGLVHGDLKPENVLIWIGLPHITDFGLSRSLRFGHRGTRLRGTPAYIPPDIQPGNMTDYLSSDIYAFGIIMREMLTGVRDARIEERAKHAVSAHDNAHLLTEAWSISERCTQGDARDRPTSFDEIETLLHQIFSQKEWDFDQDVVAGLAFEQWKPVLSLLSMDRLRGIGSLGEKATVLEQTEELSDDTPADIHLTRAAALIDMARFAEAEQALKEAAKKAHPSNYDLQFGILSEYSILLKRLGRLREAQIIAMESAEIAVKLDHPARYLEMVAVNCAGMIIDEGDFKKASRFLSDFLETFPRSAKLWSQVGVLTTRQEDHERAAAAFQRAALFDPYNGEYHCQAAESLSITKAFDQALGEYELAVRGGYTRDDLLVEMLATSILASMSTRNYFMGFLRRFYGAATVADAMLAAWEKVMASFS